VDGESIDWRRAGTTGKPILKNPKSARQAGFAMEISDIPTEKFTEIIHSMIAGGWTQTYVYNGMDAWIDYGEVRLTDGITNLVFEWDNWYEGIIKGPEEALIKIKKQYGI
jgi:hypothetical protein